MDMEALVVVSVVVIVKDLDMDIEEIIALAPYHSITQYHTANTQCSVKDTFSHYYYY